MKEALKLHMVCVYLLIMIDTLFLRPPLRFATFFLCFADRASEYNLAINQLNAQILLL